MIQTEVNSCFSSVILTEHSLSNTQNTSEPHPIFTSERTNKPKAPNTAWHGKTLFALLLLLLLLSHCSPVRVCDPIDSSPPGSPVPGILQARTLEWVVICFSSAWKWKVRVKSLSRVHLLATPWTAAYLAPPSMGFSRQECWSGVPLPSPCICTVDHNYLGHLFAFTSWYFSISIKQCAEKLSEQ